MVIPRSRLLRASVSASASSRSTEVMTSRAGSCARRSSMNAPVRRARRGTQAPSGPAVSHASLSLRLHCRPPDRHLTSKNGSQPFAARTIRLYGVARAK